MTPSWRGVAAGSSGELAKAWRKSQTGEALRAFLK